MLSAMRISSISLSITSHGWMPTIHQPAERAINEPGGPTACQHPWNGNTPAAAALLKIRRTTASISTSILLRAPYLRTKPTGFKQVLTGRARSALILRIGSDYTTCTGTYSSIVPIVSERVKISLGLCEEAGGKIRKKTAERRRSTWATRRLGTRGRASD